MTTENKHTPGPWAFDYDNSDDRSGGQWYVSGPARVWFPYSASEDDTRKALANARLIAAAPDLLEALEWIIRNPCAHIENVRAVSRDAIAKARGQ